MDENKIITASHSILNLIEMAETVAPTGANVLILGESGTGKELFAKLIHRMSFRREKKMIAINCASLPETLVESELFGFEKGSFTGSIATRPGKFELASGSTLLLDEISEMGCHMQAKLLRAIQESEIDRIGSTDTINIDLRVVATSNKCLVDEVRDGKFREDLYYRLSVVVLNIPPLRERIEDIEPLVWHFVDLANEIYGKEIEEVDNEIFEMLKLYSYPGNVRELKNIIERAVLFSKGKALGKEHILLENRHTVIESNILKENEKEAILRVLKTTGNNRTKAAEKLGISVRTLRNKLGQYRKEGIIMT